MYLTDEAGKSYRNVLIKFMAFFQRQNWRFIHI